MKDSARLLNGKENVTIISKGKDNEIGLHACAWKEKNLRNMRWLK